MKPPHQQKRSATVIDVAKRAGVSAMTVSRVINAAGNVREKTRLAVAAAIEELDYTPNVAARALVTAREIRIGVIYSNPSAAFMHDFLIGVFEEASVMGAQLTLLSGKDGLPPPPEAIHRLIGSGVRGIIIAPPLGESRVVRDPIRMAQLPMAVVGGIARDAICVRIDDRAAAYDMTRHLIALGHRRIGFIMGNLGQSASDDRLAGFDAAISEAQDVETILVQGDFSYTSGLVAGQQLLDIDNPPTAIFASNDDMAAAVVSVAHRRHLVVPNDLTVVGFDDTTAAVTLWPPLTTIHQPVRELAAEALRLLTQEIASARKGRHHKCVLGHQLIERQSTAAIVS